MANEDNQTKLNELLKQQTELFDKLTKIYQEQDGLWEKIPNTGKDADGDGLLDADETSKEYKDFKKLEEKADALWKEVEALDKKIDELGGQETADIDLPSTIGIDLPSLNLIEGTDGNDNLTGTDKSDEIFGKAGNDNLSGGKEYDFMDGGEGNDTLSGDDGDDNLVGGKGNDDLKGGDGVDHLSGGDGNDTLAGGKGGDHFSLDPNSGHDTITDFNPAEDTISLWAEGVEFKDLKSEKTADGLKISWGDNSVFLKGVTVDLSEDWFMASQFIIDPIPVEPGDVIEGTDGDDNLVGGDGWDFLNGGKGNDTLSGGKEGDNLTGGEGNDVLDGGDGFDYMDGGTGNDTMTGGEGADNYFLNAESGKDVITDFNTKEDVVNVFAEGVKFSDLKSEKTSEGLKVSWGDNSVLLKGVTADLDESWFFAGDGMIEPIPMPEPIDPGFEPGGNINVVKGTDKDDTLTGGDGYDDLYGGAGNDVLSGGKDIDYLFGEEGNDTLTGGSEVDIFFFGKKSGKDTITDFNLEEDRIDLSAAEIKFSDISTKQENGGTLLSWGNDSIFLAGVTGTISEDLFTFSHDDMVTFAS